MVTRTPTPLAVSLAWWREALDLPAYERVGIPDEPRAGFFQRRLVKGGPFVPARIWLHQDIGADGELLDDEVLRCEINGEPADPEEAWSYLCSAPISEERFRYLTARGEWSSFYAPTEAAANPRQPIDWNSMQPPSFT